ncbi:MAG: methionyl-tRNA formyltransferase [Buchnera aphidicola (Nurudea yanoniella)]
MNKPLKIIFAGTSEFSEKHLQTLISCKYNIIGILTQPDRASGRGQHIVESLVKKTAKKHDILILQPKSLQCYKLYNKLHELRADLMIVVSYGLIFPKHILNSFKIGCINIHASLLPRWRGSSPIQSAILHGDSITGITIIKMEEAIDSGKILHSLTYKIKKSDTSSSLKKQLIKLGCKAMLLALKKIELKTNNTVIQSTLTTYSKKIKKTDAQINWSQDATQLEKCIRAFNPWPTSYFTICHKNIKVWEANVIMQYNINTYEIGEIISFNKNGLQIQTGKNILNITKIQLPGKKITDIYALNKFSKYWCIPKIKLD